MSKLKVCFVTRQLDGLENNGGIGTATRYISEHLAHADCDIDIFHTGDASKVQDCFSSLKAHLAERKINLFGIHEDVSVYHQPECRPYQVYEVLKQTNYDVYLFHDWKADGFFCFLARQSGTAFEHARLGLVLHSSSEWCAEGNKELFPKVEDYLVWEMEQACCELADFTVSPSQYLFDWCEGADWTLPAKQVVIPNLVFPPEWKNDDVRAVDSNGTHLAFFGRLEERKGIKVFIDALRLLPEHTLKQIEVSFLGSESGYTEDEIRSALADQLPLLQGLHVETELGSLAARDYLINHGCIAVMPSHTDNSPCVVYECIELGIPFIISNQGGGKELVDAADRDRCCVSPRKKALAERLQHIGDGSGYAAARPSYSIDGIVDRWQNLFAELEADLQQPTEDQAYEQPLVSIVLVHHERPELLKLTLASLQAQTYPNYEIVLVDDGSQSKAALRYLSEVEQGAHAHPVRVIRQENRYLGAARNHGVREARGDYIVFFDDDNIALPHMLDAQMKAMQRSGADVVTSAMRDLPRNDGLPAPELDADNVVYTFWGGSTGLSGMVINHFGDAVGLYKKEMLLRTGGFHEQHGVTYEDWRMYAEIQGLGGRIVAIPEVLFWYRTNPANMLQTTNLYDNIQQLMQAYEQQLPARFRKLPHWLVGYKSRSYTDHGEIRDRHAISVLGALSQTGVSCAFFGAGKHTVRLFKKLEQIGHPLPAVVFDDYPPCEEIYGVPVRVPDEDVAAFGAIILSTDTYAKPMGERCNEIWGDAVTLIDLYRYFNY